MNNLEDVDLDLIFNDSDPFNILEDDDNNNITAVEDKAPITTTTTIAIPDSLDALLEEEENNLNGDEDEFADFDADELVKAAETIEQGRNKTRMVFNSRLQDELQDPQPPAPLPANTHNYHRFDHNKLCTWVYPINYPIRTYQLNMVQKALFENTLIALPTGLGKTFIAAVIMFNYWRWFPESKIIFMAPTRPLVAQQIEACFMICGLPQEDTIEMTGHMTVVKRAEHWKNKRVFFMTPQTMQNDLTSRICPAEKVACLVIDEAHKATGNYAFTEVVRLLSKTHAHFRVLALTATPGSNLDNVQMVVKNLHINNIQIRTEESMDIQEYTHGKQIQRIVIRLSYTQGATGCLPRAIQIFHDKCFKPLLSELSKFNAITSDDPAKNTPYGLMMSRQRFRENARNMSNFIRNKVMATFMTCESLSRANELLCNHGIAPFVETISATIKATEDTLDEGKGVPSSDRAIAANPELRRLITTLKNEMQQPGFMGHPKMERLISLLLEHFSNSDPHSKVMIFSSYRHSVDDICQALSVHHPMIRCSEFVGQASGKSGAKGLKQAEQQKIIGRFKRDELNTLVCTSIGEEGLDIGEVDLIVCYDSQSSPIRMLQRMGRTGRKRKGRCVLLLTEAEEKKFNTAKESYVRVQQMIARGGSIRYHSSIPSVIPLHYKPAMSRQKLAIGAYVATEKNKRKKKSDLLAYTPDGKMKEDTLSTFIQSFQQSNLNTLDALMNHYWPIVSFKTKINAVLPIQGILQKTHRVPHSRTTKYFSICIRRMEHRILHPGKEVPVSKVAIQKKLIIPKRMKHPTTTTTLDNNNNGDLVLPSKTKKKEEKAKTLDDHFEEYMNKAGDDGGLSFLYDSNEAGPSKPINSIKKAQDDIDDLIKDVVLDDDDFEMPMNNKGKRRAVEPPILYDRLNKKNKVEDIDLDEPSLKSIQEINDDMPFDRSWSSMLPSSPDKTELSHHTRVSSLIQNIDQEQQQQQDVMDFDSFGDDDDFDNAILEQVDAVIAFNDELPPVYPFEKQKAISQQQVEIESIFPIEGPTFTNEKSILLLKQKLPLIQKKKSGTLLIELVTKLTSSVDVDGMNKMEQDEDDHFSSGGDFDDILKQVDLNVITANVYTRSGISKKDDIITSPLEEEEEKNKKNDIVIPTLEGEEKEEEEEKENKKNDIVIPTLEGEEKEEEEEEKNKKEDENSDEEIEFEFDDDDDEFFANLIENKGMEEDISNYMETQYQKSSAVTNGLLYPQKQSTPQPQQWHEKHKQVIDHPVDNNIVNEQPDKESDHHKEDSDNQDDEEIEIPLISSIDSQQQQQQQQQEGVEEKDPVIPEDPVKEPMHDDHEPRILSSLQDIQFDEIDAIEKTVLLERACSSDKTELIDGSKTDLLPESNDEVDPGLYITEGPVPDNVSSQIESTRKQTQEIEFDLDSSHSSQPVMQKPKKKKNRIVMEEDSTTVILSSNEEVQSVKSIQKQTHPIETQDDDFDSQPIVRSRRKRRESDSQDILESHASKKKKKKKKKQWIGQDSNPFFEIEAERSEDDISRDDDEEDDEVLGEEDEEMDDSFINDDVSIMSQIQPNPMLSPDRPRWLSRFHAEKWLQPQNNDTIIEDESEMMEDEIDEFSSTLHHQVVAVHNNSNDDDSDDFM